jgi:GNAT superfamily N-acetyltransferase
MYLLTPADLPALARLCAAALRDPVDRPTLERLVLDEPAAVPAYQLALWDGEELIGAALGSVRRKDDRTFGGLRLLAVHPERRRRGLGTQLLTELEARMAADGINELRVGGIAPNYLYPGLDVRDTPAYCLFTRRGYTRAGEAINMQVDLLARDWAAELAATTLRDGWTVRRARPDEQAAVVAWVEAAWSAGWAWEANYAFQKSEPPIFLALREGQIGGFACHSVSGLPGTFGPTGADPALQGQGLGRALLLACLADLRARGFTQCEIGWVGPVCFYARAAEAAINRVFRHLSKAL